MRRLVGLISAALVITACGSSGGTGRGANVRDPSPHPAGSTSATPVAAALDFTLPGVTGASVRGADYAGKSLALWFWAPW